MTGRMSHVGDVQTAHRQRSGPHASQELGFEAHRGRVDDLQASLLTNLCSSGSELVFRELRRYLLQLLDTANLQLRDSGHVDPLEDLKLGLGKKCPRHHVPHFLWLERWRGLVQDH